MYFNDGADGMIGFVRLESIPIFVHVSFKNVWPGELIEVCSR